MCHTRWGDDISFGELSDTNRGSSNGTMNIMQNVLDRAEIMDNGDHFGEGVMQATPFETLLGGDGAREGGAQEMPSGTAYRLYPARAERSLTFDLHPLYASILHDGAAIRQGDVLGLDGDLRRALIAPFDGVIRLLTTGTGPERRVKVFLTEQRNRREFSGRL